MNQKTALKLEYENHIDVNEICKKLIKAYWSVCWIVTMASVGIFVMNIIAGSYKDSNGAELYIEYITRYMVRPTALMSAIIIMATITTKQLGKKKRHLLQSYVCVLSIILISTVITMSHYTIGGIYISFAFANFIALVFVDKRPILLALIGGAAAYVFILLFVLLPKTALGEITHRFQEIIGTTAFISASAAIAFFILDRNKILIANIEKETEKNNTIIGIIKQSAVSLSEIGNDLSRNMTDTAAEVNEITSNIQTIKSRVFEQSTSVNKTIATMERITGNIDKLNGNVKEQTESVARSSSAIEEMLANIRSVTDTLVKNTENVNLLMQASEVGRAGLQEVASDIQEITRESEGLLEINAVMENISSQTNLLSMNAAIEAAHAGEAGKGFAVVAGEIRKLAENSAGQSKTIGTVLKKIKEHITKITGSTENVFNKFEAIDASIRIVADQEENVTRAMEEQGIGSKLILESVSNVNEITRQVKNSSDEMAEGAREIIQESGNLEKSTQEITQGMNEMAAGADHINQAVHHVNKLSSSNHEAIDSLVKEVSQVRVE